MTQDQQPEVADALNKIETALRFQRNRIEPTGDEGVEYMLALQTIIAHLQQRPLPVREGAIEASVIESYADRLVHVRLSADCLPDLQDDVQTIANELRALASSPSVQNMGEGETGKDGVEGRKVCASPCMEGKRGQDGRWTGPCSCYPTAGVAIPFATDKELGACSISRATVNGDRTHDRRPEERDQRTGEEKPRGREAGRCDAARSGGAELGARGGNAAQHEVEVVPGPSAPARAHGVNPSDGTQPKGGA